MMPDQCTAFGCGAVLSRREKLAGTVCAACQCGGVVGKAVRVPVQESEYENHPYIKEYAAEGRIVNHPSVVFLLKLNPDE